MAEKTTDAALAPEQVAALQQVAAVVSAKAEAVSAVIDQWFFDQIHNSPVSQATEAYSHILGRLPALKAAVANLIQED